MLYACYGVKWRSSFYRNTLILKDHSFLFKLWYIIIPSRNSASVCVGLTILGNGYVVLVMIFYNSNIWISIMAENQSFRRVKKDISIKIENNETVKMHVTFNLFAERNSITV